MLEYDPVANLRHWPTSAMSRFGLNQYGQNLYRIVFAPSRRHLASDGNTPFQWIETYSLGDVWILERWVTPFKYCQRSRESWDADHLADILGPYPERGDYQHCFTFPCAPDDANLDKLIMWIEEGESRPLGEHYRACKDFYQAEEQEKRNTMMDIISNRLPSYGTSPFVAGTGVKRGTKTARIYKTANELNLPLGGNKFISGSPRKKRKIA